MNEDQRRVIREAAMAYTKAEVNEEAWHNARINNPAVTEFQVRHREAKKEVDEALRNFDAVLLAATIIKTERQVGDPNPDYLEGVKMCFETSALCEHKHTRERFVQYGPWVERH